MNRLVFTLFVCLIASAISAQPINGTTGLLCVPSADMQKDGTVMAGANYLPNALTPDTWDYDTGNYFFNITFLPFFEVNYRMTLFKFESGDFNQDRSFGMRLRLWQEKEVLPAFVIGGNDIYSSAGKEAAYFNALYAVATKNIKIKKNNLGLTAGYAHEGFGNFTEGNLKGIFCGMAFSPGFFPSLKLIGEYDTSSCHVGISTLLFRHLSLHGMLYKMKIPAGGFAVYLYL